MGKQIANLQSFRRRKSKKPAANTHNLINQLKPLLKSCAETLPNSVFPEWLKARLGAEVNVEVLKLCFENRAMNRLLKRMCRSGQFLRMTMQGRK